MHMCSSAWSLMSVHSLPISMGRKLPSWPKHSPKRMTDRKRSHPAGFYVKQIIQHHPTTDLWKHITCGGQTLKMSFSRRREGEMTHVASFLDNQHSRLSQLTSVLGWWGHLTPQCTSRRQSSHTVGPRVLQPQEWKRGAGKLKVCGK